MFRPPSCHRRIYVLRRRPRPRQQNHHPRHYHNPRNNTPTLVHDATPSAFLFSVSPRSLSSRAERPESIPLAFGGTGILACALGFSPHVNPQMNLRVPHPRFVRVGSDGPTFQFLFSSLLFSVSSVFFPLCPLCSSLCALCVTVPLSFSSLQSAAPTVPPSLLIADISSQLHRHRFHFRIIRQPILPQLSSNSRLLEAPQRRRRVEHVVAIHPHRSRPHAVRDCMRLRDIPGPHRGRQPIQLFVRPRHHFIHILKLQNRHHRPENLFLRDLHIVLHVGKHRRLDEIPFLAHALSARQQLGLLVLPALDVPHHLIKLLLVHLRPLLRILVKRIAHRAFLRPLHALRHEFVVALLLHKQPRARAAALPLVEEQREMRPFNRLVHVRVRKHDVRALSSQLQRHPLQIRFRRRFHDQVAHFRRSRERHLIHIHVPCNCRSRRGSIPRQNIHHAFREPRFQDQFAHAQRGQRRLLRRLQHHRA